MKKIFKLLFLVVLCIVLICGCSQTETPAENSSLSEGDSSDGSSSEPEAESFSYYDNFIDEGGNKIKMKSDLASFKVNYALGWNLLSDEYTRIEVGDRLCGFLVCSAASEYTINYYDPIEVVCTSCSVGLGIETKGVKGIFVIENSENGEKLAFYPYYEEFSGGFYFLYHREEFAEKELEEKEVFEFSDGSIKKVQPMEIKCTYRKKDTDDYTDYPISTLEELEEFLGSETGSPKEYIEATVYFDSISFYAYSSAPDVPMSRFSVEGGIEKIEINGIY